MLMNTVTGSSATTMVLVVWHNSLNMLNSLMLVEPVWGPHLGVGYLWCPTRSFFLFSNWVVGRNKFPECFLQTVRLEFLGTVG